MSEVKKEHPDVRAVIDWFRGRNVPMPGAKTMYEAAIHYMERCLMDIDDPCVNCANARTDCMDGGNYPCKGCELECACKSCGKGWSNWKWDGVK